MESVDRLTERERAVLRLLATGHDAKSIAAQLDVSVHAVNERLRKARQKLGVASSREAARRLLAEEAQHNSVVDEKIDLGDEAPASRGGNGCDRRAAGRSRLAVYWIGAIVMLFLVATAIAFWTQRPPADLAPRVVSTYPLQGGVIPAGVFTVRVTFDRPMQRGDMSFVRTSVETYPDCDAMPAQSRDGRSFSLICKAQAGRVYEMWFNRPPFMHFQSVDGVASVPYRLRFTAR
ncbi:LuxR family transcriptional regulator [Sphingomonas koreensis]|nr:LuxR family transcriptional regulator [Sphingomonas koreensis]